MRDVEWFSPRPRATIAPPLRSGALAVVAVSLIAWFDGILAYSLGAVPAGLLGIAVGLVLGRLAAGGRDRTWIAVAFLPVAILLGAGLVPSAGRYLPILVVAAALAAAAGPGLLRDPRSLVLPTRLVVGSTIAYLAWFALSTLTSSEPRTSIEYLAGAVGTLVLVLVLIPTILETAEGRRALLVAMAVIGPLLTIAGIVIAVLGPPQLYDQPIGRYTLLELTVLRHPVGIVVPRITSIYYSPGYPAVALVVATIAALTLLGVTGTPRRLVQGAVALSVLGLAATFDRNGLLALAVGAGVLAGLEFLRRRVIGSAAVVSLVSGLLIVGMLLDAVGANLWLPPIATTAGSQQSASGQQGGTSQPATGQQATSGQGEAGEDDLSVRGGTSLSGRDTIWRASVSVIRARPLLGWGPGTNADALGPYLGRPGQRYVGLTSHDTWLRTAVELGIPGLLLLLAFMAGVFAAVFRLLRGRRNGPFENGFIAIFVGLIFAFTFETFLLGGLSYGSVVWPLVAAMLCAADRRAALLA